jgi:Mg-chelatase subunit ChlD
MAPLDSGLALGLIVVDSHRPQVRAGFARRLCKQSGAALQ